MFQTFRKMEQRLPARLCCRPSFVQTKSRSRPVPRSVIANVQAYVTLTWMKFNMRIGPPSRVRQNPEGRRQHCCFYESREKFACENAHIVLPSSLFLSFSSSLFFSVCVHITMIVRAKSLLRAKTRTSRADKEVRGTGNVPNNEASLIPM